LLFFRNFFKAFDNIIEPLETTKVNLKIFFFCCLLILIESIPWSYKWSGVLSMTQTWELPRGFLATVAYDGLWPFGTENLYYLNQIQAFLGVEGTSISLGSGFELQRSLYAFIVKTFWFLNPILASILVNVILWMFFVYCIQYIIRTFSHSQPAQAIGGVFVAAGQGFLNSVGEIAPHVLGYGSHYIIFALACRQRIWQKTFIFYDHIIIYAAIGLLQLGYDSAWLSLPILVPISIYCIFRDSSALRIKIYRILFLVAIALLPSLSFSIISGFLLKKGGVLYYLLTTTNGDFMPLIKSYLNATTDGLLSYGPILLLGYFSAILLAIKNQNYIILYFWIVSSFLFFAVGVTLLGAPSRGYVTFSFSPIILLLATYGVHSLWDSSSHFKRATTISLLFTYVLYNNSPLLQSSIGNNWILQGFGNGYLQVFQRPNTYRSFECDAFN
jgi:hypothetical protein